MSRVCVDDSLPDLNFVFMIYCSENKPKGFLFLPGSAEWDLRVVEESGDPGLKMDYGIYRVNRHNLLIVPRIFANCLRLVACVGWKLTTI